MVAGLWEKRLDRLSKDGKSRTLDPDWRVERLSTLSYEEVVTALTQAHLYPNFEDCWQDQPNPFRRLWKLLKDPYPNEAYLPNLWAGWEGEPTYRARVEKIVSLAEEGIQNDSIREAVCEALRRAPLEFWVAPTSATGKHHMPAQNFMGGNLLHEIEMGVLVEFFIRIHEHMATGRRSSQPEPLWLDCGLAAVLLHDTFKGWQYNWWSGYAQHHEILAALAWELTAAQHNVQNIELPGAEGRSALKVVALAIYNHSGHWSPSDEGTGLKMLTPLAQIVHFLDMISAARKTIVDLDGLL